MPNNKAALVTLENQKAMKTHVNALEKDYRKGNRGKKTEKGIRTTSVVWYNNKIGIVKDSWQRKQSGARNLKCACRY